MEILKEDYELVVKRIRELEMNLRDLANVFRQTLTESSETWHDNSPWENAKAEEAVYLSELENLTNVLKTHKVVVDTNDSLIGKNYKINFNGNDVKVFLAGDFSMRSGQRINDHIIVTKDSPIGKRIIIND